MVRTNSRDRSRSFGKECALDEVHLEAVLFGAVSMRLFFYFVFIANQIPLFGDFEKKGF